MCWLRKKCRKQVPKKSKIEEVFVVINETSYGPFVDIDVEIIFIEEKPKAKNKIKSKTTYYDLCGSHTVYEI